MERSIKKNSVIFIRDWEKWPSYWVEEKQKKKEKLRQNEFITTRHTAVKRV